MKRCLVPIALLCTATAFGIETRELLLRSSGDTGDATITRDPSGNIVFSDVSTSPTTLYDLARRPTTHGLLDGLSGDDHTQYLNMARHTSIHDAGFNGELPLEDEVNGNATLGAHVSDADIHPNRLGAESIVGEWAFGTATFAGGRIVIGESVYTEDPAIRFTADPAAEFTYNADAGIASFGAGFNASSIAGIAAADLLSSTRAESVSEPWTFLAGIDSPLITQGGLPSVRWRVVNAGSGSIDVGEAVKWTAISSGVPGVAVISGEASADIGFAGFAIEEADEGDPLVIAVFGVVDVVVSGTAAAGTPVAWDGSGIGPVGGVFGYGQVGIALEPLTGSGTARLHIQRAIHPEP